MSYAKMNMYFRKLDQIELLDFGNTIEISGMILNGNENSYFAMFPDRTIGNQIYLDLDLEDWKTLLRQLDLQEVEVLMDDNGGIKKAIIRKSARQIESRISWKVFKRDEYKCRYCGRDDVPLTVDHLILWEDGGPSIEDNLLSACSKCNKKRGNMKYEDWLDSEQYKKVSQNLSHEDKLANVLMSQRLDNIPRKLHIPSRGKKKKR